MNEVLSFYQTSIFLLKPRDKGLISFMNTVRPLTLLISDIAVLCDFKNQNTTFEGINILTHIYQQANSITRPNTSLVITSILKSCCEVYFRLKIFRFFQNWNTFYPKTFIVQETVYFYFIKLTENKKQHCKYKNFYRLLFYKLNCFFVKTEHYFRWYK